MKPAPRRSSPLPLKRVRPQSYGWLAACYNSSAYSASTAVDFRAGRRYERTAAGVSTPSAGGLWRSVVYVHEHAAIGQEHQDRPYQWAESGEGVTTNDVGRVQLLYLEARPACYLQFADADTKGGVPGKDRAGPRGLVRQQPVCPRVDAADSGRKRPGLGQIAGASTASGALAGDPACPSWGWGRTGLPRERRRLRRGADGV